MGTRLISPAKYEYYCDRCGSQVETIETVTHVSVHSPSSESGYWEVCPSCSDLIRRYLDQS